MVAVPDDELLSEVITRNSRHGALVGPSSCGP
jgi:hypothetical protein